MLDPPAGAWFKEQAAELVALAQPALEPTTCEIDFDVRTSLPGAFLAEVSMKNVGTAPLRDWSLSWAFPGSEQIVLGWGAGLNQSRDVVTARAPSWDRVLFPGARHSFGFIGRQRGDSYKPLLLFLADGSACNVR
jgi:endoglucanase